MPLKRPYDIEEVNSWYYNEYNPEYMFTNENEYAYGKAKYFYANFLKTMGLLIGGVSLILFC